MSVKDENMRTNQALKIAIEAKRMKESVLDKNPKRGKIEGGKEKVSKLGIKSIIDSLPSQTPSMIDLKSVVRKKEPESKTFITQNQSQSVCQKENSLILPQIRDFSTFRKTTSKVVNHTSSLI